jgi:serine/threonine protein kinase
MEFAKIPHILSILQQCIEAIAVIHSAGICHRDIKLENFMVTFEKGLPVVKLIDFGLSEDIDKISNKIVGSPLWIAPEVIRKGEIYPISQKSDLWSFGIILLEVFLGKPPIDLPNTKDTLVKIASLTSPPIPQKLRSEKTAAGIWLCSIAKLCLQINPVQRQSAEQMVMLSKTASF